MESWDAVFMWQKKIYDVYKKCKEKKKKWKKKKKKGEWRKKEVKEKATRWRLMMAYHIWLGESFRNFLLN